MDDVYENPHISKVYLYEPDVVTVRFINEQSYIFAQHSIHF